MTIYKLYWIENGDKKGTKSEASEEKHYGLLNIFEKAFEYVSNEPGGYIR